MPELVSLRFFILIYGCVVVLKYVNNIKPKKPKYNQFRSFFGSFVR
jgi:hypothetical protein